MPDRWRVAYLSETTIHVDGETRQPMPEGWWGGGVGELLTRLATHFDGEGVVILTDDGARRLGLPDVGAQLPSGGDHDHPAVQDAARAGWSCSGIGDWSTFRAEDRPTLRLGLAHCFDRRVDRHGVMTAVPLWDRGIVPTLRALTAWHELTGSAYYGAPGMAGMQVMRALAPQRHAGKAGRSPAPTWKPREVGPSDAWEDDYRTTQWTAPERPTDAWLHGYDANRMYIAAAMLCEVAPWGLKHTGRTPWSPRLGGWWLVELAPWNESRLPDPAGYDERGRRERWVSAPTMGLLHELTEAGVYGGVRILDSWTGPARDSVLRPWATRMRDAYALIGADGKQRIYDSVTTELVRRAIKQAGRSTLGLLDRPSNWVYRPDWWYSIIAMARSNMWRKLRAASRATPARWPVTIDVDNVYYASNEPDAVKAAPDVLKIDESGMMLGHFKCKKSLRAKGTR